MLMLPLLLRCCCCCTAAADTMGGLGSVSINSTGILGRGEGPGEIQQVVACHQCHRPIVTTT